MEKRATVSPEALALVSAVIRDVVRAKRLPAAELKIDRGFIQSLEQDGEDAAIVSSIIALGQTLSLRIVAEGVETEAQQKFLTEQGCDSLQGYLLSRPVPAEEVRLGDAPGIDRAA